ncbi:MAG: protein kinase [Planctomycetes bacterium]|nr:protein kinase [Planctomycetota bacterium]
MNDPHENPSSAPDDFDRTHARPGQPGAQPPRRDSEEDEDGLERTLPGGARPQAPQDFESTRPHGRGDTQRPPAPKVPPASGETPQEDLGRTVKREGGVAPELPDEPGIEATYARPADVLKTRASSAPRGEKTEGGKVPLRRTGIGKTGARTGGAASSKPPETAPVTGSSDDPLIGKVLGGCRIDARLGAGGMGTVYRARQLELDRDVALKMIKPEFAADSDSLKRFQREAKAVGKFRTPHVMQIYQVGSENGVPFLVLELLLGGNLRELAEKQPNGRLAVPDAIRYLKQTALALADAAEKGLIHRDIKPDNLMLDDKGVLKVTDFGISKATQADVSMTLTAGGIVGTPMYMSPEQCRGEEIDFRSDMWSLGATFFFLLTGKPPAKGSSLLELIRTKNEVRNLDPAKILPDAIPGPLSDVIRKLTMLSRDDRYPSYDALIDDLDKISEGRVTPRWLRQLVRWSAAVIVIGGAGLVVRAYWEPIEELGRSTYERFFGGNAKPPEKPPEIVVVSPDPTIDLVGIRETVRSLSARVVAARDLEELRAIGTDLEAAHPTLEKLPADSPDANLVREELKAVEGALAAKREELARASESRDRQIRLTTLTAQVAENQDLPQRIRDIEELLRALPQDKYWEQLRTGASNLLVEAKLKLLSGRLAELEEKFRTEGPKTVETLASELVVKLEEESTAAPFETLRTRARDIDHDVKAARDLEVAFPSRPAVRSPFEEIAVFVREVEREAAETRQSAKTEILERWVASSRSKVLENPELITAVNTELVRVFGVCDAARQAGDVKAVIQAHRELEQGLRNLEGLGSFDPHTVVSRQAHDELEQWIAQNSAVEDLLSDIEAEIAVQRALEKVGAWLRHKATAESVAKELSTRAGAENVRGDERAEAALTRLRNEMRFWTALAERSEKALSSLAKGELGAAEKALALTEPEFAGRDVAKVEEIAVLRGALAELRAAFAKALGELDPAAANELFDAARRGLSGLPDALAGRSAARIYAEQCAEKCKKLEESSRGMLRVRGGEVVIATGQGAAIDGTHAVESFFLDRRELDRATFKAQLDANALRGLAEAELQELRMRDFSARPDLPALELSRAAASACLQALGRELPTHAEWWLATKGPGANDAFPWGNNFKDGGIEVRTEPVEVRNDAHPLSVGGEEAYHLIGNAAEWVSNEAKQPDGVRGMVVGGSFGASLQELSSAARGRVRVVRLTGAIEKSIGCRGVVRPRAVFGNLVPKS